MNIISPEFSFLDFNYIDNDVCDNEQIASFPVCNDLSIKAQFSIESETETPTTEALYIAIADEDCNVILDNDIEVTPICSKYKFLTTYEDNPVPETDIFNLCNTDNDEPISVQDFTSNPFDLITSDDLTFTFNGSTTPGQTTALYINNYIFIFKAGNSYSVNILGNIYQITLDVDDGSNDAKMTALKNAIVANVDPLCGTTTTFILSTTSSYTIANIPTGSYINNTLGFLTSVNALMVSGNVSYGLIYYGDKINYIDFGIKYTDILYSYEQALTATQWYEFKIAYSAIYTDIVGTVTFDNGVDAPTVENIVFDSFSGVIKVAYLAVATSTYTITIELTDVNGHINGLSFNSIKLYDSAIFTVTANISGNIPSGEYTKSELIALISDILGFDFDCEFTSCCEVPEIEFETTPFNDQYYVYKLTPYWQKGFVNFPELPLDDIDVNCFTYVILDSAKELIACSNLFHKETDCCYITKIEYSNNEDSFGFTYPEGVTNMVSLPFYLHSPSYPTTEKIYKQTNGQYKRLSADIEKEYECETDYFNDPIHDKLITALKHDNIIVTSNRLGITDQMTQQGDYNLNWNSKIEFTAMAEFKLKKYFNGKNSNCGANC